MLSPISIRYSKHQGVLDLSTVCPFAKFRSILYKSCAKQALKHCDLASASVPNLVGQFCNHCLISYDSSVFASRWKSAQQSPVVKFLKLSCTDACITHPRLPLCLVKRNGHFLGMRQLVLRQISKINHELCFSRTCFPSLIIKEIQMTV